MNRGVRVEGAVQVVIMLAIGAAAGAASFTHVHNVAAAHGQGGWLAWADAVVLELMSIASGLELRWCRRRGKPVAFPAAVLVCAVALSISAQVVEAEQSVIGWISAALPALGFLVMVKFALGRAGLAKRATVHQPATGVAAPRSDRPPTVRDPADTVRDGPRPDRTAADGAAPARTVPADGADSDGPPAASAVTPADGTAQQTADPGEFDEVAALLPAATAARDALAAQGRALSREALTELLRKEGHALSNVRASRLVKILKTDGHTQSSQRVCAVNPAVGTANRDAGEG